MNCELPKCDLANEPGSTLNAILFSIWSLGTRFSVILLLGLTAGHAFGDAIVVTKAMSATTIAEVFVEDEVVRVELEIGPADLPAFANLLPDDIYRRLEFGDQPVEDRLKEFFAEDWVVRDAAGVPLTGQVSSFALRKRIKRDEITGDPLPNQPENAEVVAYVELRFPLPGKPPSLSFQPPTTSTDRAGAHVGFVTYHKGLPVTDFRYLSAKETLDLDWQDPWYSSFRNRNLKRQFDSPVSVFLYVEPFEVRKEIVIRPVDLQRWTDLDLDPNGTIAIGDQAELKRRVAEFFEDKHPVTIDGKPAAGELDRIHFIRRTLRQTGVVYPDEDLSASSATLGIIYVYPIDRLPDEATLTWELFDERIQSIPSSATDEAGGLPWTLTPDDPRLVWKNYLTNPTIPAMRAVPPPPERPYFQIPVISLVCLALAAGLGFFTSGSRTRMWFWIALLMLLVAAVATLPLANVQFAKPFVAAPGVDDAEASAIVDSLLHNLYHAFDRREEGLVYDQLEQSLSGDLLQDVYLQTRRRIRLEDQGGAQIKIDHVEILGNEIDESDSDGFSCECEWNASGTVGHWGHLHRRLLGYTARFRVQPVEDVWKITSMQVIDETQPEVVMR